MKPLSLICFSIGIFVIAILLQMAAVICFVKSADPTYTAEAVLVMGGGTKRDETAALLARQGKVKELLFTNREKKEAVKFKKIYSVSDETVLIGCGTSHSSFEDIYSAVRIIRDEKIPSVILVTSDYHMPRALFLFRSYLFFSNVHVSVGYVSVNENVETITKLHLSYSETVKFVGSTFELILFKATGGQILQWPTTQKVRTIIKKILLL